MSELEKVPDRTIEVTDIERIEAVLLRGLSHVGLPTDDVLTSVEQRAVTISNLPAILSRLSPEQRARSAYISKFVAATAAGLFDAALNYLWDETIAELRARMVGYDLKYFFDVAEPNPDRRKRLRDQSDLEKVTDADLVRAANEMGLVSDIGRIHLEHIRQMRNWASAAHPNQVEVTGLQLASWLETCILQVINLPISTVVAEIRKLLANIKTNAIEQDEARQVAAFFDDMPDEQAEALLMGLFGIYTDPDSDVQTRQNVRLLLPFLWPQIAVEVRNQIGVRYGRFIANNDKEQADAAREFLDTVDGTAYIPEGLRAAEMDTALEALAKAHYGWDNFYNEGPAARRVRELAGTPPDVPEAVTQRYVLTLVDAFLTNGVGVARTADPVYVELIRGFTTQQAKIALTAYRETGIAAKLQHQLGKDKLRELVAILRPKLIQEAWLALADAIRDHPAPDKMRHDADIQRLDAVVT